MQQTIQINLIRRIFHVQSFIPIHIKTMNEETLIVTTASYYKGKRECKKGVELLRI